MCLDGNTPRPTYSTTEYHKGEATFVGRTRILLSSAKPDSRPYPHPANLVMKRETSPPYPPSPVTAGPPRCDWARTELGIAYHDTEWGVPQHDDRRLFEFLILEGAQAGLSWETILRKRPAYREAFDEFDPSRVARYDARKLAKLLTNPGIVRNRLKISGAVQNARSFLAVRREFGSFDQYVWRFVGGTPIQNRWTRQSQVPARTAESDAMSKSLRERGFTFVGTTICYTFMQAVGMVNDHLIACHRYNALANQAHPPSKKRRAGG